MQQDETMTCYKRLVYFTKKLTEGPDLELTHLGGWGLPREVEPSKAAHQRALSGSTWETWKFSFMLPFQK